MAKQINYLYDANGQKLQKMVVENGSVSETTDYLSGFQYENSVLKFFPTAEGYVSNTVVSGVNNYKYVFNYTDHLGNIRLSYGLDQNNVLKILEENNYYPFGLKHNNYNVDKRRYEETILGVELRPCTTCPYQYKFQGQERQDELGLNWDSFKWRNYDYAIGRFMSIDPLSEKYAYQSHYNFSENRVIDWRELEGLEGTPTQQWNGAFKTMIKQLAGAFDAFSAKASATVSSVTSVAPGTKVEKSTTASVPGTNFLNFLNGAEFNNGTPTSNLWKAPKVESKTEVKVGTTLETKVGGVGVQAEGGVTKNLNNGQTTADTKIVVGAGGNGVFVENSTNTKTGESKTTGGVQVEAETPAINNTSIKVNAKIYIGDD